MQRIFNRDCQKAAIGSFANLGFAVSTPQCDESPTTRRAGGLMKGPRRALLVMKGAEAPGWKRRRRVTAKPRVRLRSGRNPGVSREQERALQGRRRVLKLTRKTCVALAGLISGFIPSRGLRPGLCCPALSALQLAFVGCAGLLGACRNGRAFSSLAALGGGLPWVVSSG